MIGNTIGMVSSTIASESSRQPSTKYIARMTSRIASLPSGRPVIQSLIRVGIEARIRKLLNRMAPIRMVKIIAVVFTVSISALHQHLRAEAAVDDARISAPTAPMLAASVGEKMPI